MSFENLGLSPKVLEAVNAAGFDKPTPIQEKAIPPAIEGRDVLGLAQTGSGKTAAFTLPMLTRLEKGRARARMPRSLILEPTRELAAQVHEAFETFGQLPELRELAMSDARKVTGSGLEYLRGLRHLDQLTVQSNANWDAAIDRLMELKQVKQVTLIDVQLNQTNLQRFKRREGWSYIMRR